MNKTIRPGLYVAALLLGGCAFGYQARGTLSDAAGEARGEMRGKAYPGNTAGGGRFSLEDRPTSLRCDGTLAPPDATPSPGSCAGESGRGEMRCSDGRVFVLRWQALTCRSLEGSGEDGRGGRLVFRIERPR